MRLVGGTQDFDLAGEGMAQDECLVCRISGKWCSNRTSSICIHHVRADSNKGISTFNKDGGRSAEVTFKFIWNVELECDPMRAGIKLKCHMSA